MYSGVLILESLKVGTELDGIPLVVRRIRRSEVPGATAEQGLVWSLLDCEAEEAERLAEVLAGVLDQPGWYADFHDAGEIFVVFPGRVFRYRRGDGGRGKRRRRSGGPWRSRSPDWIGRDSDALRSRRTGSRERQRRTDHGTRVSHCSVPNFSETRASASATVSASIAPGRRP